MEFIGEDSVKKVERHQQQHMEYSLLDITVITIVVLMIIGVFLCTLYGINKILETKIRQEIRRSRAIQG